MDAKTQDLDLACGSGVMKRREPEFRESRTQLHNRGSPRLISRYDRHRYNRDMASESLKTT